MYNPYEVDIPEADEFKYVLYDSENEEIEIYESLEEAIQNATVPGDYVEEIGSYSYRTYYAEDDYDSYSVELYRDIVYENKEEVMINE